jgi:phosphoglycerol transferase
MNKDVFQSDDEFVQAIEDRVPPGAMIFQLPHMSFYEHPAIHRMVDYDHLRGYFHSRSLRWSYGAIEGRPANAWQSQFDRRPPEEMVRTLCLAGFSGLFVDRLGYPDAGAALEAKLGALLQLQPLVSRHGDLSFFDLAAYTERLRKGYSAAAWEAAHLAALESPLHVLEGQGFSGLEQVSDGASHWCAARAEFEIVNPSSRPRTARLSMMCRTSRTEPSHLHIESSLFTVHQEVQGGEAAVDQTFTVPPGRYRVRMTSDAPRLEAPNDPRELVFRVVNLSLTAQTDR